jgi:hypothetical protein
MNILVKGILTGLSLAGIMIGGNAYAQQQSGTITPGHAAMWAAPGVLQDGGTGTNGYITNLGLFANGGLPLCITGSSISRAFFDPAYSPYSQLCLFTTVSGNTKLTVNTYNGASGGTFAINLNGIDIPLFVNMVTSIAGTAPITASTTSDVGTIGINLDSNFTTTSNNLALASIAAGYLIGNSTSSSAEPSGVSASSIFDQAFSTAAGAILYRGTSSWLALAPGTVGQILQARGSSTSPMWTSDPTFGIPGSVSGGVTLANGNTGGASAVIQNLEATSAYNFNLPAVPGTSGQVLTSAGGGSSSMTWTNPVTQVNTGSGLTGGPITTTGTISLSNQAGGTVLGNVSTTSAIPTGTATPILGIPASTSGSLGIANGGASGQSVTIQNPSTTSAYNFNLPASAGTAGQVLSSGGGVSAPMTWANQAQTAELFWYPPTTSTYTVTRSGSSGSGTVTNMSSNRGTRISAYRISSSTNSLTYAMVAATPGVSSQWSLTVRLRRHWGLNNYGGTGIIVRNSANGYSKTVWLQATSSSVGFYTGTFSGDDSNTGSTAISSYTSLNWWQKVVYDGTNLNYYVSQDGDEWELLLSEAASTYLTAVPTHVGVAINPNIAVTGTTLPFAMDVLSWQFVSY